MYRAAENYKNKYRDKDPEFLEPNDPNNTLYNAAYFARFKHYEKAEDTPEIKDSNVAPETMRGFVLENEKGEPASIILAGITRDHNNQPRVMMGTIDTDDKYEGRGYFSICSMKP